MGQEFERAQQVLMSDLGSSQQAPELKPIIRKQQSTLPKGVERIFTHKFETSGNSLAVFRMEKGDTVTYRVTTVFSDGTIVRDDLQKWELARKLMGRKPKEASNG